MKANEAPEKIYIQSFNVSEEDEKFARLLYFDDVWTEEPELGQTNIEYTRTDAFIEKACSFVKRKLNDYIVVDIDNKYEGIDGLFFEDFRKYMEGE